jgi:predicted phosphodiesterase
VLVVPEDVLALIPTVHDVIHGPRILDAQLARHARPLLTHAGSVSSEHPARRAAGRHLLDHTHKPFSESIGGARFFNPGYAGKSRFGLERSVAILHCGEKGIRAENVKL